MVAQTASVLDFGLMGRRRTSDPKLNKSFGRKLKALVDARVEKNPMFLDQMAVATEIKGNTLQTYVYGTREPGLFTAAKIALYLGIPMEELIPEDLVRVVRSKKN